MQSKNRSQQISVKLFLAERALQAWLGQKSAKRIGGFRKIRPEVTLYDKALCSVG